MTATMTTKLQQKVCFDDVMTIQEYPMELGDHPSCSAGAPLTIGWEPEAIFERSLELYEHMRTNGPRRFGKKQLAIPVHKRAHILLAAGYSLEDIGAATLQVSQVKKQRADTIKNQGWDRANIMLERTGKLPSQIANVLLKPIRKSVPARTA